jgi:hypothetical protein
LLPKKASSQAKKFPRVNAKKMSISTPKKDFFVCYPCTLIKIPIPLNFLLIDFCKG